MRAALVAFTIGFVLRVPDAAAAQRPAKARPTPAQVAPPRPAVEAAPAEPPQEGAEGDEVDAAEQARRAALPPRAPEPPAPPKAEEIQSLPAPEPKPSEASESLARDLQTPSPGGVGRPRALLVETPEFSLALRGFAQFQAAPLVGRQALVANGDAAEFAGFRVRRLQLGVEGRGPSGLSYGVWLDLLDPQILSQARLAWGPLAEVNVEFGVVRVPFSKSAIQSSAELAFQERPLAVDRFVPDRQPGVALYGAMFEGRLSYRAGVFNGAAPARVGLGNDHPGLLTAGRVALSPLGPLRPGQEDAARGDFRLELGANAYRDEAAGFTATAVGADLSAQFMGASVLLEYLSDVREPRESPVLPPSLVGRVARSGFIGQASYVLWPRGLSLAVRAEQVDDHDQLQDAGDAFATALGLHWCAAELDLRVNADWYRRQERFGPELENDVLVVSTQGRF
jgi:hypothetical protein